MSRYILLIFFFFSLVPKSFSQTNLNDYSYLIVPEQFEFLSARDEYRLNALTKFLLDKRGFNTYMADNAPDALRCDGLYADVVEGKGVFKTKLTVIIKSCEGDELLRSFEGVSKEKEYKKAYHEALRNAFKSFDGLTVIPKDIVLFSDVNKVEKITQEEVKIPAVIEPILVVSTTKEMVKEENNTGINFPKFRFSAYFFNDSYYLLRKAGEVYWFYEDSNDSGDGLLLIGKIEMNKGLGTFFLKNSEGEFKVSFDAADNLTLQNGSTSEEYKKID